ncbi:MAG TPA: hypothetical protein VLJ10_05245 [Candidatus Bathyarchaeia archaeon]|nr:hypothetical protein [Candidatus Bathyarchaeia archaeon]
MIRILRIILYFIVMLVFYSSVQNGFFYDIKKAALFLSLCVFVDAELQMKRKVFVWQDPANAIPLFFGIGTFLIYHLGIVYFLWRLVVLIKSLCRTDRSREVEIFASFSLVWFLLMFINEVRIIIEMFANTKFDSASKMIGAAIVVLMRVFLPAGGIAASIGLFMLKNWARLMIICFSGYALLVTGRYLMTGVDEKYFLMAVVFCAGIFSIYFSTRPKVKEEFNKITKK